MAVLAFTSLDPADRNLLSGIQTMKLQSFVVGLIVAFGTTMALAQTEPTVAPAGTETTSKPHKKSAKNTPTKSVLKSTSLANTRNHPSPDHLKPVGPTEFAWPVRFGNLFRASGVSGDATSWRFGRPPPPTAACLFSIAHVSSPACAVPARHARKVQL